MGVEVEAEEGEEAFEEDRRAFGRAQLREGGEGSRQIASRVGGLRGAACARAKEQRRRECGVAMRQRAKTFRERPPKRRAVWAPHQGVVD